MKKLLFIIVIVFCANAGYSQSFSKEELKKYSGQGNKRDDTWAAELAKDNPLNDQNEL